MEYNQSGAYAAMAALGVMALAHFGVIVDSQSIITDIAGIIGTIAVIRQFLAHKKLAITAGVYKEKVTNSCNL